MLDMNGVEIKVGDKFVGFAFSSVDYPIIGYVKGMDNDIGKLLTVTHLNTHSDSVSGHLWSYPAELVEIIVDNPKKSDTIKTSKQQAPKRTLWAVYSSEGVFFGAEETRRQARELNRSLGGGLQIFKMQAVKQSN